jgi:outer membrane protein insertion porin family
MNLMKVFARSVAVAVLLAVAAPVMPGGSLLGSDAALAASVSRIVVQGNKRVESSTVANYITIKPGKSFGPLDIDASIKSLYGTGLFTNVTISQSGNSLVVAVVEAPVVNRVLFEGNKKIKNNILITQVDTKPRSVLSDAKLQSDVARIRGYYASQGRGGASIETRVDDVGDGRVDVVFVINDGMRTGVKTITFIGNKAYSSSRLRGLMQTRTSNIMSWLNKRDVYDEARFAADQEALRRFYMSHGYADFRILSAETNFDEEKGKYYITITVDEGERYFFGNVSIDSSIPGVDTQGLMRVLRTRSGNEFNATLIERTIEDLSVALSRSGFAFAQVRPRGDRDYTKRTVDLTYMIDEGPRMYVERIDIRGNTKTRDFVIRREFEMSEGDPFNRALISKAERRLRNTGYFQQVSVTTEGGSAPDRIVVVVTVIDQSTGSFAISGGYSTESGFIAEISMEEKNFLGRGQIVKVSLGRGTETNTFNVSFSDPYFLGYRMLFGVDAYKRETNASKLRPYDGAFIGGGVKLGLPITDDLNFQLNYKIVNREVSNNTGCDNSASPPAVINNNCIYFPQGTTLTSSLGYQLLYSTIDNFQDPRSGVYFKLNQDVAGIGGDTHYLSSTFDARYYRPITSKADIVGFVRLQGGNITGLGEPVSMLDNFYKGGETVRGFSSMGIGARSISTGTSLGGTTYIAGTAEVQYPIPFFPKDFGLRGAVFADAGTLFGADVDALGLAADVNDGAVLRSSIGTSLLWASPFGNLRADFSLPVSKAAWDQTEWFRFGFGNAF